jgi:hypothetical protein
MVEITWTKFDRNDPASFPSQDRDLVVETANGQTFPARFIARNLEFSLKWSLWGNQGAVIRWRYAGNRVNQ